MPIRAENRKRYSADWKEIRKEVLERAKGRCEGCGVPDRILGYWGDDEFIRVPVRTAAKPGTIYIKCKARKIIRIILTVAHFDHRPENNGMPGNRPNLRALCQRCHNRYDLKTRVSGRIRRRMEATGTVEMKLKVRN